MQKIKIGNKWLGEGRPCFIIAEIGSNHNRSLKQARKLIDVAIKAKADAVKFQSFRVENWISKDYYPDSASSIKGNAYRELKKYELPYEMYIELDKYCKHKGIICFSSPSHITDVKRLMEIGLPAVKFGSVQITDHPTIEYAAKFKKPIMISAGAANLGEVSEALAVIKLTGNNKVVLFHCTSLYPAKPGQANLNVIKTFKDKFPDVIVGYSDHTLDVAVIPAAAVALGAKVIEKHITLDRTMPGPDHKFALEPGEFITMVKAIRDVEKALGSKEKKILSQEKEIVRLSRRSLVAQKNLTKGEKIKKEDIAIKRPGYGIVPKFLETVVGRTVKKNIMKNRVIKWDMLNES